MKKRIAPNTPRLAAVAVCSLFTLLRATAAHTWIEVEDGQGWDAIPGVNRWGGEMYSNGLLIHLAVGAGAPSEAAFGEEGKIVSWPFTLAADGTYDFWFRTGFENVRAVVEWRLDNGGWQPITRTMFTTDLRQIAPFCELGWAQPAAGLELKAGVHTLELRFTPQKKDNGEPEQTLFMGDAFVFATPGTFKPYNHFKPGEDHRTDADREAAEFVFNVAGASSSQADPQGSWKLPLLLNGQWEIARVDEWMKVDEADRLQPMSALPEDYDTLRWSAIRVPGNLLRERPDYALAHRVLFRTRVLVPADWAGRSF